MTVGKSPQNAYPRPPRAFIICLGGVSHGRRGRSRTGRLMETLTIQAASAESARGMLAALSVFEAELVETPDGRREVVVTLAGNDSEIVAVLNALERYVTERASGPARVELNGRAYVMEPGAAAAE